MQMFMFLGIILISFFDPWVKVKIHHRNQHHKCSEKNKLGIIIAMKIKNNLYYGSRYRNFQYKFDVYVLRFGVFQKELISLDQNNGNRNRMNSFFWCSKTHDSSISDSSKKSIKNLKKTFENSCNHISYERENYAISTEVHDFIDKLSKLIAMMGHIYEMINIFIDSR